MSLLDPRSFLSDLDALEALEKSTLRMLSYSMHNILTLAADEFEAIMRSGQGGAPTSQGQTMGDRANYLGEDLTRMALDAIGLSKVPGGRLFGAIDYKVAALSFLPGFAVEQALFVDSKAEKNSFNNCRVQVTQTSLEIRQIRAGRVLAVQGMVEKYWESAGHSYITTTNFVKYHYDDHGLKQVTVACVPHGYLQDKYNPTAQDGIWNVGPDSPALGEKFRTRLNFKLLQNKASWRVQRMKPNSEWKFEE